MNIYLRDYVKSLDVWHFQAMLVFRGRRPAFDGWYGVENVHREAGEISSNI